MIRWLVLLAACSETTPPPVEDDPAATGGPVGVRTETLPTGAKVEIWYPAVASAAAGEDVAYDEFIPAAVLDVLGPIDLPTVPSIAARDAEVASDGPYPVVLFSHGFGGMRVQSVDLTSHLASRGYVVLSTDHAGRTMGDLLPCLFAPPLDGCVISFEDPGPEDIADVLAWLDAPPAWLAGAFDLEHLAIAGHSAGAGTAVTVANGEPRFDAVLPLAGGDVITRDLPALRMAGTCDGVVPAATTNAASADGPASEVNVQLAGAGHLAFSDLCALDLAGLGEELFAGRDDVNTLFLEQLLLLGSDGCADATPIEGLATCESATFLNLDTSGEIVRYYATVALDAALRGVGPGAEPGRFPEAEVAR